MSLDKVEDMFSGFKPMLAYLVEDLVFKGKMNEAKGVVLRNDLEEVLREDVRERLSDINYNKAKDYEPYDVFGPLTTDVECIRLPENVSVDFITKHEDIMRLD
jgi:hypothetical protein